MDRGENFKRNNLPSMQQIRYLIELYNMDEKKGAVMKVAKICGVDHGAVSRYFKSCRARGFFDDRYRFTELGKSRVEGYQKIIMGLEDFFREMSLAEEQVQASVKQQVENVEYDVLMYMVKTLNRRSRDNSVLAQRTQSSCKGFQAELFAQGRTPVWFMLLHMQAGGRTGVSMADRGFEKPAYLCIAENEAWLELKICEMTASSRVNGQMMNGHLESLKYARDGFLYQADIEEDGTLKIPLAAFRFHRYKGGEIKGLIQITATCNVGRTHMPESTAMLLFWM